MMKSSFYYFAVLLVLLITNDGFCQFNDGEEKKELTMDDYGLWRSVTSTRLSNDGNWMTFDYRKPEADEDAPDKRNLQIKHLESEIVYQIPRGIRPVFSDDSRWIAYIIDSDHSIAMKSRDKEQTIERNVQLLNLKTGEKVTWENATTFSFSSKSDALCISKAELKGSEHSGIDLIVYDLKQKVNHPIGSVSEMGFNKQGSYLGYIRDAADKTANGLYIMDLESYLQTAIDQDTASYSRMTWDESGTALAVLKGFKDKNPNHKNNQLITISGLGGESPIKNVWNPALDNDFPENMVISEFGWLTWNSDASKVFFGIKEQRSDSDNQGPERIKGNSSDGGRSGAASDVDIWHWNDVHIQSVQRSRAGRERLYTFRAVYNLPTKKFVQLSDKNMKHIEIPADGKWGIGRDEEAYIHDYKPRMADYYRVDTDNGERLLILKALKSPMGLSPDGRYFTYWKDGHFWIYDLYKKATRNLTQKAPVSFTNLEYDYYGEKPPYGIAGWSKDGKYIILNHKYDLWLQAVDGSEAINLTGGVGSEKEIRLRYIHMNYEDRSIDLDKTMILSAYGQWTKKAGFYRLEAGADSKTRKAKPLIFEDKSFSRLVRAKNADQYMFSMESYVECPDYYVSDGSFSKPRRMTDANPQQAQYHWGKMVLLDYTNKDGVRLQGALAIPDTRKEGERLPLVVGFYEKTSQYLNEYERPRYASSSWIHLMEMVSKGYMMMYADIHFRIGSTMDDMLECVEAAVDKAVELGYADPEHVGLMGHSFSGAGAIYIAAKSQKFSAVSAGAGAVDPSGLHHLWGYSSDRKTGGGQNAHQYEIYGQGRMGDLPIVDYKAYGSGSFIDHAPTMSTPLLLTQGESDDIVAWMEAVYVYNTMRFYGKEVILLSYPNEGHSLHKRVNRIDLTQRTIEFFDHYLKGMPPADWIEKGVPFLEKK